MQLRNLKFQLCVYGIHTAHYTHAPLHRNICIFMHMETFQMLTSCICTYTCACEGVCCVGIIRSFRLIFVDAKHKIENFFSRPLFSALMERCTFFSSTASPLRPLLFQEIFVILNFSTIFLILTAAVSLSTKLWSPSKIDHNICRINTISIHNVLVQCTVLEF